MATAQRSFHSSSKTSNISDDERGKIVLDIILPKQWPSYIKHLVLFQVAAHASMGSWCAAAFIPAFTQMSKALHRSVDVMTYLVGSYTLMMGFGVLVWNPLADRFGRRPVILISMSIAIVAACGVAKSDTYGNMMVARIFQGFGICAPLSLGASYIKDMYHPNDRGKALGVWTLGITAGPFIAPFISGFIVTHTSYTWIIWLEAMLLASLFVFELLFLPEAVTYAPCFRNIVNFSDFVFQLPRASSSADILYRTPVEHQVVPSASDSFKKTLRTIWYPVIWLCGLGFAVPYGYIAVSISSLFPTVYGRLYKFNSSQQGLLYLPMLIGSILAELITGRLGDWVVEENQNSVLGRWIKRRDAGAAGASDGATKFDEDERVLEARLLVGLAGTVVSIAGLLWYGISVERHAHWANPAIATGFAAFGIQMLTSACFSYVIDCYPRTAKEVATVMNLFRVLSTFVVLFYNSRLNAAVGYDWSYGIQSLITAFFTFSGLISSILWGGRWRKSSST